MLNDLLPLPCLIFVSYVHYLNFDCFLCSYKTLSSSVWKQIGGRVKVETSVFLAIRNAAIYNNRLIFFDCIHATFK